MNKSSSFKDNGRDGQSAIRHDSSMEQSNPVGSGNNWWVEIDLHVKAENQLAWVIVMVNQKKKETKETGCMV